MKQMDLFSELEIANGKTSDHAGEERAATQGECAFCGNRGDALLVIGPYTYCSTLHRSMHSSSMINGRVPQEM